MAGIAVAHIYRDRDDAFLCLTQHSPCSIHSQIDVILRRRHARGTFEQAIEMKLGQPGVRRQPLKVELFCDMFGHPVGDLSKLEASQRRAASVRL